VIRGPPDESDKTAVPAGAHHAAAAAHALLGRLWRRAEALLAGPAVWAGVERLANELRLRRVLTGRAAKALYEGAPDDEQVRLHIHQVRWGEVQGVLLAR
jgi:hypothetical protein